MSSRGPKSAAECYREIVAKTAQAAPIETRYAIVEIAGEHLRFLTANECESFVRQYLFRMVARSELRT